jgi:peptidase E
MTKYILVGGYPHKALDGGKAFSEELVKDFNEPVKILDCLFARPTDNWQTAFAQDKEFFSKHLAHIMIELELADPAKFINQLRWANAIYIRGGTTALLMDLLSKTDNWISELNGKTLAGSSAGADLIGKYYYDLDTLELGDGLGLVSVKTLVHYGSDYNAPNIDWAKAEKKLKNYKEDLEILKLSEGGFKVIKQ